MRLPQSDWMIRGVSLTISLLILALILCIRKNSLPLPAKTSAGLNITLACCDSSDEAAWQYWKKIHNPGEFFAFSRSPEKNYLPQDEKYLPEKTFRSVFTPAMPLAQELAAVLLPELKLPDFPPRVEAIPPSLLRDDNDIPALRTLEVWNGCGGKTGVSIVPVPFQGKLPRPVLFRLRTGKFGNDFQLIHSSGDSTFDAGVRKQLRQKELTGTSGELFCVWPGTPVKGKKL